MQRARFRAPLAPYGTMAETRFEELKRYVRFDADDARALLAFRPIAAPHFTRVAREFYERIREHEEAHAVFSGEEQIDRLQRSMVRWMDRLLSGTYDDAYQEQTLSIGRMHVRVGLPQRYMFTAMALIRVALEAVAERELGTEAPKVRSALTRLLDLELATMLESYREDLAEQAKRRDDLEAQSLRTDLVRALRLYETAIDVTTSLVIGVDSTGAIRLCNRATQALTGHALPDVFGRSFVDTLVAAEARDKDDALVRALLEGPARDVDEESMIETRAGKVREVRWRFTRMATALANDIVLFAVGSDVTDARAEVEQLHRQQKLAALGTLAAGLAHEIRNPLNGAQLHIAFLKRALEKTTSGSEPAMIEAVTVVADEIKRLARLVSEFLDFARPGLLSKSPLAVQGLVSRVIELTSTQAANAGIAISADMPPQDLIVVADGGKIEQVLLNIVQNALDALTPAGSGNVVVRARRTPRAVVVEVEDDGPGLPSPDAPIFDAFFSTKPSGTGLGLAITHRIVTDHGGTLDVESHPGRTCFRFTIPVGRGGPTTEEKTR
jgi:PAS domain S-box-containing protein